MDWDLLEKVAIMVEPGDSPCPVVVSVVPFLLCFVLSATGTGNSTSNSSSRSLPLGLLVAGGREMKFVNPNLKSNLASDIIRSSSFVEDLPTESSHSHPCHRRQSESTMTQMTRKRRGGALGCEINGEPRPNSIF